jgi:hypothetical protein
MILVKKYLTARLVFGITAKAGLFLEREGAGLRPFKLQGRTWSGGRGSQCPTPDFPTNIPLKEPISDTPTVRRAVLN